MPERTTISNTSPLFYLHQIRQLDLLEKIYGRILVPMAVEEELQEGAVIGAETPDLVGLPWLEVLPVGEIEIPKRVGKLGAGEAGAIALGIRFQPAFLLLDDRAARREALALGMESTGTLGVLIKAKKSGLIPAFTPLLERLRRTTLWLGDDVITEALRLAGEL